MIKLNYTLPLLIIAVCFSTNASATIVVTGNLSYDDSTDIITSVSGPQYASWDTLAGSTYAEALEQTRAGGSHEDFHIASQVEAFEFYRDAITPDNTVIHTSGSLFFLRPTGTTQSRFAPNYTDTRDQVFYINTELGLNPIGFILLLESDGTLIYQNDWGHPTDALFHTSINASWLLVSDTSPVPVPAAVWLMGSGLLGLMGYSRNRKTDTVAA